MSDYRELAKAARALLDEGIECLGPGRCDAEDPCGRCQVARALDSSTPHPDPACERCRDSGVAVTLDLNGLPDETPCDCPAAQPAPTPEAPRVPDVEAERAFFGPAYIEAPPPSPSQPGPEACGHDPMPGHVEPHARCEQPKGHEGNHTAYNGGAYWPNSDGARGG